MHIKIDFPQRCTFTVKVKSKLLGTAARSMVTLQRLGCFCAAETTSLQLKIEAPLVYRVSYSHLKFFDIYMSLRRPDNVVGTWTTVNLSHIESLPLWTESQGSIGMLQLSEIHWVLLSLLALFIRLDVWNYLTQVSVCSVHKKVEVLNHDPISNYKAIAKYVITHHHANKAEFINKECSPKSPNHRLADRSFIISVGIVNVFWRI